MQILDSENNRFRIQYFLPFSTSLLRIGNGDVGSGTAFPTSLCTFPPGFEEEAEETQYAVLYLVALKYRWQCDFFIITFVPLNVIGLVFSSKSEASELSSLSSSSCSSCCSSG